MRLFTHVLCAASIFATQLSAQAEICRISEALDPEAYLLGRHHIANLEHQKIAGQLHARLLTLDARNQIVPELAESWDIDNETNSITFNLATDCGWSDGTKVTAQDMVMGLQDLYRHDPPSFTGWQIINGAQAVVDKQAPVEALSIEALDDQTLRIETTTDPAYALYAMAWPSFSPLPSHRALRDTPVEGAADPVYSGPFYVSASSGDRLTLKKNPYFCDADQVAADERLYRLTASQGERMALFRAGRIDVITNIPTDQAIDLVNEAPEEAPLSVLTSPTHRQANLFLMPNSSALQDREIRAALRDVFDLEAVIRQGTNLDLQTRQMANSVLHGVENYENIAYPTRHINRLAALAHLRELMEEKGYSQDNPARLTITTFPVPRFKRTAQILGSMMTQAHFRVEQVEQETSFSIIDSLSNRDADMYLLSWTLDFPHARNSWDGIVYFFSLLKDAQGQWPDLPSANDFFNAINTMEDIVARSHGEEATHAALNSAETMLTEWHFVLPIFSEVTPILVASDIDFKGPGGVTVRFGHCQ